MDSFTLVVVCVHFLFGFSLQASGSLSLTTYPERFLYVNAANTPLVNISCVLRDDAGQPVPLAGCSFKQYRSNSTLQFNEGAASPNYTDTGKRGNTLIIKYYGQGLERGECGLTFVGIENDAVLFMGCRVRPVTGVSHTGAMVLFVKDDPPMQYRLEPPGVTLALAGSDVTFKGTAEHKLDSCRFLLPPADKRVALLFDDGPASANHSLGTYHGAGLDRKECGVTLTNVQAERSGFVGGGVFISSPYTFALDFVELIVATAPESPPLLTVLTPNASQPGDLLVATCLVKNSRPAANVTWHVGDEEVTNGVSEDGDLDSTWRWNHDPQTVQSRLRLQLVSSHDGKKLMCRAGHLAWPSGVQNSSLFDLRVIS